MGRDLPLKIAHGIKACGKECECVHQRAALLQSIVEYKHHRLENLDAVEWTSAHLTGAQRTLS